MQELLTHMLGDAQGFVAYATVFSILVACGLGIPLPEDISLILGGFLAHKGAANLPMMMVVGFAGILAGDSLIFLAGRRLSEAATLAGSRKIQPRRAGRPRAVSPVANAISPFAASESRLPGVRRNGAERARFLCRG